MFLSPYAIDYVTSCLLGGSDMVLQRLRDLSFVHSRSFGFRKMKEEFLYENVSIR